MQMHGQGCAQWVLTVRGDGDVKSVECKIGREMSECVYGCRRITGEYEK